MTVPLKTMPNIQLFAGELQVQVYVNDYIMICVDNIRDSISFANLQLC